MDGDIQGALYDGPTDAIERYCLGGTNSTGQRAVIHPAGSLPLDGNDFRLSVTGCPPQQLGMFLLGLGQQMAPFGEGFLCIGGTIRRIPPVLMLDASGYTSLELDFDLPYVVDPGPPG